MNRPTTPEAAETPATDAAQTGSLLADLRGSGLPDAPSPGAAPRRRRVSSHNLVTVLVLVAAGGLLFGMRQYGMGAGMTFAAVKIDYPLDKVGAKPTAEEARLLSVLEFARSPVQVPSDEIDKNPFELEGLTTADASLVIPGDDGAASRRAADELRRRQEDLAREIATELAGLQLHGVMGGTVPLARISGKTYMVGDSVGENFRLTAIHGRSVEVEAMGVTHELSMDAEPAAPKNRKPAPGR